jgi:hypothetical protein
VRDLVFLALVVGFFVVATLFVRACRAVVGVGSDLEDRQR